MRRYMILFMATTLVILAGNATAALISIRVTPADQSILLGQTEQFVATGIYSNGPERDITSQVNWTSSNTAVATISNGPVTNGLVTSVSIGATTITATYSGISGSSLLKVAPMAYLPKTGQTTCYDSYDWYEGHEISCTGTGQDGDLQKGVSWPDPRFTTNPDTTITDNLTGLIWMPDAGTPTVGQCTGGGMVWLSALDYVACLNSNNYLGHSDWRLPNINELSSLFNYGHDNPLSAWLNDPANGFINVQNYLYWSSTLQPGGNPNYALSVEMSGDIGNIGSYGTWPEALAHFVWPVRSQSGTPQVVSIPKTGQTISYFAGDDGDLQKGVTWPNPRFSTNPDGTIKDNLTQLIWSADANTPGPSACNPTGIKNWPDAFNYVACLNSNAYLGHSDWRIPNMNELMSLVNRGYGYQGPWLESQGFINVPMYTYFLSSDTPLGNIAMNRLWDSGGNGIGGWKYGANGYIWPVRGGQ